jgi:hypothetical protein
MINFKLYKECGQWKLLISNEGTKLPVISFNEEVSYDDIVALIPILCKGDILTINVNFTENK